MGNLTIWNYDKLNRVEQETNPLTEFRIFEYDEVGNVLTRFDDLIDKTETFSYDALNRLHTTTTTRQSRAPMRNVSPSRIRT